MYCVRAKSIPSVMQSCEYYSSKTNPCLVRKHAFLPVSLLFIMYVVLVKLIKNNAENNQMTQKLYENFVKLVQS